MKRLPASHERAEPATNPALPPGRGPGTWSLVDGRPDDPDALRREIEATRTRMSRTVDDIEATLLRERDELVRRKDELVARVTLQDFRRRFAVSPWRTLGIALVAGYVVAALRD